MRTAYNINAHRKYYGRIELSVQCVVCGIHFNTYYPLKKTCSEKCSREHRMQNAREKAKEKYITNPEVRRRQKERKQTEEYKRADRDRAKKRREMGIDTQTLHPEKSRGYQQTYYYKHREQCISRSRACAKRNPESIKRGSLKRKNIEKGLKLTLPSIEVIKHRINLFGGCCYCDGKKTITLEHLKPISKGGTHARENLLGACRSCNSSKQNKDFKVWFRKQKFYTPEREIEITKACKG